MVRVRSEGGGVAAKALVPARALSESSRAASERGAEVTIVFEEGQASFPRIFDSIAWRPAGPLSSRSRFSPASRKIRYIVAIEHR